MIALAAKSGVPKMDHREKHPMVKAGIHAARAANIPDKVIAREIGISPQVLTNFMSVGHLGEENTEKALKWLQSRGFTGGPGADPMDAIALQLERALPIVKSESGYSIENRAATRARSDLKRRNP